MIITEEKFNDKLKVLMTNEGQKRLNNNMFLKHTRKCS